MQLVKKAVNFSENMLKRTFRGIRNLFQKIAEMLVLTLIYFVAVGFVWVIAKLLRKDFLGKDLKKHSTWKQFEISGDLKKMY